MKDQLSGFGLAFGLVCLPLLSSADLIEKRIVSPSGEGASTGVVFQGSRNMRNLGKRRSTVSSVVVPSLNPVTVIPALRNEELQPKPRFGYGSDYRPGAQPAPQSLAPQAPMASQSFAPIYQFRYSYPVYRDYFITSPFHRYYSPFYSCGRYGGWTRSSSFSRFSLSFGW